MGESIRSAVIAFNLSLLLFASAPAQSSLKVTSISVTDSLSVPVQQAGRTLSGVVITQSNGAAVPGVRLIVRSASGEQQTTSDAEGKFRLHVPVETLRLKFFGKNIALLTQAIGPDEVSEDLRIQVEFIVPPIHENVVIVASQLDPSIERRDDEIYRDTLSSWTFWISA